MTRLVCWLRGHVGAIHLCQPPNGTPSLVICERCRTVLAEYARSRQMTEPVSRWWLLWRLYGLPRCSQAVYPMDYTIEPCHALIWPWQTREIRNGSPVHIRCLAAEPSGD